MSEPQTTPQRKRHYWIFSKPPAYFNARKGPQPGDEIVLHTNRYFQGMQPGDVVYLGSGQQGLLINAWGLLTSEARQVMPSPERKASGADADYWAGMICSEVVTPPVTYEEVNVRIPQTGWLAEMEDGVDLVAGLADGQAVIFNELIRSRPGVKAPPDPSEAFTEEVGEGSGAGADAGEVTTLRQVLNSYKLSVLSREVLKEAGNLARDRKRHHNKITTSCVLFAAILSGKHEGEPDNAAQFLNSWLRENSPGSYGREFENFLSEGDAAGSSSPSADGDDPRLSSSTRRVVETAQKIADYVRKKSAGSRPRQINARDLVGALLYEMSSPGRERGATRRLRNMDASLEDLRTDYVKRFLSHPKNPEDDLDKWAELLIELKPVPGAVPGEVVGEAVPWLPRIDSDTPSAKDHLNITPEVQGFARIIATSKVSTPLSIGLFGDWGSGKSTFMEQLQAEVERIAGEVRRARAKRQKTDYLGNIVQIKFNAWHYAEANLWASLVNHIFENLSFSEEKAEKQKAEDRKKLLLAQLDTSLAAQEAAAANVERKKEEYKSAETALDAVKQEQSDARVSLRDVLTRGIWPHVEAALDQNKDARELIKDARKVLGKEGLSAEDLKREIDATRTVAGRAQVSLALMMKDPPRALGVLSLLAAAILIPLGLSYAVSTGRLNEFWDRFVAGVTPLLTLAGVALAWLRSRRAEVEKMLGTLDAARGQLDRIMEATRSRYDADVSRLETEVRAKEAEVDEAVKQLNAARQLADSTVTALRELEPAQVLERFVQERAASTDYRKLLGVVALIRSDFKRLSDLLREQDNEELREAVVKLLKSRQPPAEPADVQPAAAPTGEQDAAQKPDGAKDADESGVERAAEPSEQEVDAELEQYRIDRIVLYIDDLDRCPPKQVVDVLQAIHLLLAFELFVVVVGVDARWVRHALRKQYPDLLGEDRDADDGKTAAGDHQLVRTATPRDYVEKIFQVPFWLKPMGATASRELLRNLIPDSDIARPADPNDVSGERGNGGRRDDGTDTGGQNRNADGGSGGDTPGEGEQTVEQTARDRDGMRSNTTVDDANTNGEGGGANGSNGAAVARKESGIPLMPKSLMLEAKEREAMIRLSKVIGKTPRTMKRFVNVYRIIKAGLGGERLDALVGEGKEGGEYRAVLMLLAVAHGAPEVAPLFFRGIKSAHEPTGAEAEHDPGLKAFLETASRQRSGSTDPAPDDWPFVIAELQKFAARYEDDIPLAVLVDWAPVVVRYTFQLGRLSEEIDPPEKTDPEETD